MEFAPFLPTFKFYIHLVCRYVAEALHAANPGSIPGNNGVFNYTAGLEL